MPKKHDLASPPFRALIHAWAELWATGKVLSEAIVVEAATAALNAPELEAAKGEGREPRGLTKTGTMRDRFGHLIREGLVVTRERGETRRTALALHLGTVPLASATLADALRAYLEDPTVGKSAKDAVTYACRFILPPGLPSGTEALLRETALPRYGADALTLLHAEVDREWRLRQEAADAGRPVPGRGPVRIGLRDNHRSAIKRLLVWAGVNGVVPMVAAAQGSIAWHEGIARWFGTGSDLSEETRRTYGANARLLVELLGVIHGTDRPEPDRFTPEHLEGVLDHLYLTGQPRAIQRLRHIANAMAATGELPLFPPSAAEEDVLALPAARGETPHSWDAFDAYLGAQGLAAAHPLRAYLRYHARWCTGSSTDRTMPRRRQRQKMESAQSERRRIAGLRTWLGMACRVHRCALPDLTLAAAFGVNGLQVVDDLQAWWERRVQEGGVSDMKSQGLKTFLVAGEQAMQLALGVLDLEEGRTTSLAWLPELRAHEREIRLAHGYLRDKLADLAEDDGEAPVVKDLAEILRLTGPLWWLDVRDRAVAEMRELRDRVDAVDAKARKEGLERAHDLFALLLLIATMGRGREYTTVRLDRQARTFAVDGVIRWSKCDTKNKVEKVGVADAAWVPADLRAWYLDVVRPELMRLGKTPHKNHAWLLLVPGTGAPLGDPAERTAGRGTSVTVTRDEDLVTRHLSSFRQRLWCLVVELAVAAGLKLPPRRLYGALTLHAIRANMAFAGVLAHSMEVGAGLLGDSHATAERSYSVLRAEFLHLRPALLNRGYTLPNERVAGEVAQLVAVATEQDEDDEWTHREAALKDDFLEGRIGEAEYTAKRERLRRLRELEAA